MEANSATVAAGIQREERTPSKRQPDDAKRHAVNEPQQSTVEILPARYGSWQSVYARFAKWREDGVWVNIFAELNKEADIESFSIDSTCVKVYKSSNGGEKAENKAVAFLLSPGNDNDSTHAIELMKMTDIAGSNLLGDKAYGTKEILAYIQEHGATAVISPKSNAKQPLSLDKERHLVGCFFLKIKWFRRLATRYDKLDSPFLAFVYIVAIYYDLATLTFFSYFSNKA